MAASVTSSLDFQKYAIADPLCPDVWVIKLQISRTTSCVFSPKTPPLLNTTGMKWMLCFTLYASAYFWIFAFSLSPAACSGVVDDFPQYVIAADVTMLKSKATLSPSLVASRRETSMSMRSAATCLVGVCSETSEIGGAGVVWMCACLARSSNQC